MCVKSIPLRPKAKPQYIRYRQTQRQLTPHTNSSTITYLQSAKYNELTKLNQTNKDWLRCLL